MCTLVSQRARIGARGGDRLLAIRHADRCLQRTAGRLEQILGKRALDLPQLRHRRRDLTRSDIIPDVLRRGFQIVEVDLDARDGIHDALRNVITVLGALQAHFGCREVISEERGEGKEGVSGCRYRWWTY